MKGLVIRAERRILNTLGFVVHVHHPHKLIYVYLNCLELLDTKDLLQKAWLLIFKKKKIIINIFN